MSVKKDLVANYLGVGWSALMGVAFVPFYLRFIGAVGYGLIGFFVVMSASLAILDAGLTAVATREASGYLGSEKIRRIEIVTLLGTIEVVFLTLALLVGLFVLFASPYIVEYWLNVPLEMVTTAGVAEFQPPAWLALGATVMALGLWMTRKWSPLSPRSVSDTVDS